MQCNYHAYTVLMRIVCYQAYCGTPYSYFYSPPTVFLGVYLYTNSGCYGSNLGFLYGIHAGPMSCQQFSSSLTNPLANEYASVQCNVVPVSTPVPTSVPTPTHISKSSHVYPQFFHFIYSVILLFTTIVVGQQMNR